MTTDYATCRWHPDRRAGVICQRCDAPICPSCMHQASVGFHCPDCAAKGAQKQYHGRAAFGGGFQPVVTIALIAVNVVVFLITVAVGQNRVLFDYGSFGPLIAERDEWYRIVTSGFLHQGIAHVLLNMYSLWSLGPVLERVFGRVRYGLVYAVALVAGGAGGLLVRPDAITVGASGAIFGLAGALVVLYRRAGIDVMRSGLGFTLAFNLLLTFTVPAISIGGHIGGFIGGVGATWLIVEGPRVFRSRVVGVVLAGALIPLFAVLALVAASTWTNPLFGN